MYATNVDSTRDMQPQIIYSIALAGNRTRVTRMANENSTTEPPMHLFKRVCTHVTVHQSNL